MRDGEIRAALHADLTREHADDPSTRFVDELALCGLVRVDVAVINGTLSGYELKSDQDTLRRLPEQVRVYSQILDRATLVVGEKHQYAAVDLLPGWWGVTVASDVDGHAHLQIDRPAVWNDDIDPYALAQLLWRDEVLVELAARDLAGGVRSKPRTVLWRRLADELDVTDLRATVRRRLKGRAAWRSRPAGA